MNKNRQMPIENQVITRTRRSRRKQSPRQTKQNNHTGHHNRERERFQSSATSAIAVLVRGRIDFIKNRPGVDQAFVPVAADYHRLTNRIDQGVCPCVRLLVPTYRPLFFCFLFKHLFLFLFFPLLSLLYSPLPPALLFFVALKSTLCATWEFSDPPEEIWNR